MPPSFDKTETEIEITLEMIEAGVEAFRKWNPIEDNASWIVEDVFEEMAKASKKQKPRAAP